LLPPPLFRDARRGSSASGWLRRAGFAGSFAREPDSDFSSLPMLPPELPDCAWARLAPHANTIDKATSGTFRMSRCFQYRKQ
jgi:hypothetical protein